ncbi:hypothetical protein B0H12DRAFT_1243292 [Mycena haematopus]|nr:hypothetical protein B0H12DRAFT_1243292 [Mycena haematopus]
MHGMRGSSSGQDHMFAQAGATFAAGVEPGPLQHGVVAGPRTSTSDVLARALKLQQLALTRARGSGFGPSRSSSASHTQMSSPSVPAIQPLAAPAPTSGTRRPVSPASKEHLRSTDARADPRSPSTGLEVPKDVLSVLPHHRNLDPELAGTSCLAFEGGDTSWELNADARLGDEEGGGTDGDIVFHIRRNLS